MTTSMQVSALDAAYAISALLEYPHNINEFNDMSNRTHSQAKKPDDETDRNMAHQAMEQKKQRFQVLDNLSSCLHDNFWVAYDALEFKNAETLLVKGIKAAKQLQEAIIRQGSAIIEKKDVKVASNFRYVMLENDYLADIKLF